MIFYANYRDPNDVFREFFGGADPFEEMLDRKYHFNQFSTLHVNKLSSFYISLHQSVIYYSF